MKKAIIDQMMLGLFLFVVLIMIGATVSDNMQARDKYYNLKKITDNAVLTLAKYYVNVEENTLNAQNVYYQMLTKTKLGNEVKDTIIYNWDFVSEPNTVTAEIPSYIENTFWFRLFGLNAFNLKASSKATITITDLPTATSSYSSGIAPFAVNYRDFVIGDSLDITYALTADWQYSDKETFYPILTNCDCDCDFILSNKFDFSSLGFDVDACDASSSACTSHGESEFTHYSNALDDIYNSNQSIDFDNGVTSSPICLIGTYLGNTISTWGTQINGLSSGIYDIIGNTGQNLPLEMDIITLGDNGKANGIVRLKITSYDFVTVSNPDNRYLTLNTTIVPAKTREIHLVD
jgi:hypothetical protein